MTILSNMTDDLVRAVDLELLLVPSGVEAPVGLSPIIFYHQYHHILPASDTPGHETVSTG